MVEASFSVGSGDRHFAIEEESIKCKTKEDWWQMEDGIKETHSSFMEKKNEWFYVHNPNYICSFTKKKNPKQNIKNIKISVSQNHSHFFSPNRNDSRENTFLINGMRVKYLDISQTFFSFLFMLQLSFFNRAEKIWILEFCCTSSRELPFAFFICVLFSQSLLCPVAAISPVRLKRGERHSCVSSYKVSLSAVELQRERIQNFPKMSLISQEKRNQENERRANQSDWVLQQGIASAVLFMKGEGSGNGRLAGGTVLTSKILKSVFAAHFQLTFPLSHSLGP